MLRFFTEVRAYWPVCDTTRAILWALWISGWWKYHCKLSNLWDILPYHKESLSVFLRTEGNALANLVQFGPTTQNVSLHQFWVWYGGKRQSAFLHHSHFPWEMAAVEKTRSRCSSVTHMSASLFSCVDYVTCCHGNPQKPAPTIIPS